MIKVVESFGGGYRLMNTNTGKYLQNNAENRSRAMFCMLLENEASKSVKSRKYRYSVEELAKFYGTALYEARGLKKLSNLELEEFIYIFDRKVGIDNLEKSEVFVNLAKDVLKDQQDEYSMTNIYDVETLKHDYKFMDEKIFEEEKELTL